MFKQIILVIILSILAVLFVKEVSFFLQVLSNLQKYVSHLLSYVFSGDHLGRLIREVVVLSGIPILLSLIVNAVYWLIKKRTMPVFTAFMWLAWVLLVTTMR